MGSKLNFYSFDVFDTCLVRQCGNPEGVFCIVAQLAIDHMKRAFDAEYLMEKFIIARKKYGNLNNLIEIYEHVSHDFPLPLDAPQMAELEMSIERKMLRPVANIKKLIGRKRKQGRIIFISDMYLPSTFIKSILLDYGVFHEGDALYVSNEMNARKYDGSLFRLIRKKENIKLFHWHHYGDDKRSDIFIPRYLGIRTHIINHCYLRYENDWRNRLTLHYPYASMLAGLSRSVRLSCAASLEHSAFVCDIAAPMMVMWVTLVMDDAVALGIRKLFFCARDTYPEFHIAQIIKENDSRHRYDDLEIHYLFVSSKVLYQGDKATTLKYFEQEGVATQANDVALADSHSTGNSFRAINEILIDAGYHKVMGYLICLSPQKDNKKTLSNYPIKAMFSNEYTSMNSIELWYLGMMTEQIFSLSNHYRTTGYSFDCQRWKPLLTADPEVKTPDLHNKRVHQDHMLREFTQGYIDCGLLNYTERLYSSVFEPTMIQFATLPHRIYIKHMSNIYIGGKTLPYVQNCLLSRKEKAGRWLQGSLVYTFSRPIASIYLKLQNKAKIHKIIMKIWRFLNIIK